MKDARREIKYSARASAICLFCNMNILNGVFKMFKLIMRLFQGKWKLAFMSFICLIILSFDGIISPYFLGEFTNVITAQEYGRVPLLLTLWFVLWMALLVTQISNAYFFNKLRSAINIDP